MRIAPRAVGAGALLMLGLSAGTAAGAPGLVLSACELEHPLRLSVVAAECGVLSVAENPQDPAGRSIPLHVARVPAISRRKRADALFILAGGPGAAASAFYTTVAGAFARIHRERDIVLIDQRGTGGSNPLDCAGDAQLLYRATPDEIAADTRRCLTRLSARADVAYYTSSLAVQDLERVRAALGVQLIDLYGSSYGTRVAQHYLRRFPQRVRALILDGWCRRPWLSGRPRRAMRSARSSTSWRAAPARAPAAPATATRRAATTACAQRSRTMRCR
jgi:pimeloyl-ACP methyl ester carboxylesterase